MKTHDRELYPALLITALAGAAAYLVWRFWMGSPPFPACWFYRFWHVYCPACGGTRAVEALMRGKLLEAVYWNPAVPFGAVSVAAYLLSQTVWRLRGRCGRVLHYQTGWLAVLLAIMAIHCAVRNLLWFAFGVPL